MTPDAEHVISQQSMEALNHLPDIPIMLTAGIRRIADGVPRWNESGLEQAFADTPTMLTIHTKSNCAQIMLRRRSWLRIRTHFRQPISPVNLEGRLRLHTVVQAHGIRVLCCTQLNGN